MSSAVIPGVGPPQQAEDPRAGIQSSSGRPLEERIVLAAEIRDEALFDLSRMNINRAVLFPDIDGFATHLRDLYELRYRGAAVIHRDRMRRGAATAGIMAGHNRP